ncbi:hypothetical protein ACFQ4M_11000 [Thauera mechernichensis]|uniref:Glycosyltransferase RgtA/B/C/D-like domain-containing protein n=1 Tax=Thauera mechernichensis TaxID=82788 RepID=A0ABW3WDV4_9RHOO|nr:hypothetical protein [Thauera mechernichensis]MDG3064102.1 hypothetical protein [Thauera mechernichensis]
MPKRIPVNFVALAIFAIIFLHGRWDSITYPIPLNPDEAQVTANSLRILNYGFNWNALDGTTAGPLNSIVISWPYLINSDVTFSLVRATALFILLTTCFYTYLSISLFSKKHIAALFTIPVVLFYSYTNSPEFLHYTSETLSTLLLVLANYIVLKHASGNVKQYLATYFALGLLVGLVPFAKLQSLPAAFVIGIYTLFLLFIDTCKNKAFRIVVFVIGALVPPAFFLLHLHNHGEIADFWLSYITWSQLYVKAALPIIGIHHLISSDALITYFTYFLLSVLLLGLLYITIKPRIENPADSNNNGFTIFYLTALLVIIFWSIAKPGNLFPHYLMYIPPFAAILSAYSLRPLYIEEKSAKTFTIFFALMFLAYMGFFYKNEINSYSRIKYRTVLEYEFSHNNSDIYSWIPVSNRNLLVWGWMPHWYVWSNRSPATRESHTYAQIVQSELSAYFRERFMRDFKESDPDIVIDAVRGKSFGFNNPEKQSPNVFPAFSDALAQRYSHLAPLKDKGLCPRVYIKNEVMEELRTRKITPKSISISATHGGESSEFTPYNLFDYSLTEDTCTDYWLLPDNTLGSLLIRLHQTERLAKLMILNTRNSYSMDRSSGTVLLHFKNQDIIVNSTEVKLKPHPYWTIVEFEEPIETDSVSIDILDFNGLGAGLNEIMLERAI